VRRSGHLSADFGDVIKGVASNQRKVITKLNSRRRIITSRRITIELYPRALMGAATKCGKMV